MTYWIHQYAAQSIVGMIVQEARLVAMPAPFTDSPGQSVEAERS